MKQETQKPQLTIPRVSSSAFKFGDKVIKRFLL